MRHSVSFNFSGTRRTILNSQVMDSYGKVPFNVVSDKKHTTVHTSNGITLAVVEWNHWTPVMHYGGKQLKCKEWIVLDKSKRYVWLTHSAYPSLPTSPADTSAPLLCPRSVGFVSSPTLARNTIGSHATRQSACLSLTRLPPASPPISETSVDRRSSSLQTGPATIFSSGATERMWLWSRLPMSPSSSQACSRRPS